jgi:hypothetical protein
LRAPAIRALMEEGAVQRSLFDERDLAEITSPAYPGERLVACRNPLLAEQRARKRRELLAATQKELDKIVAATQRTRNRLKGKDRIALRVGRVIQRFKMSKHFRLQITEESFGYERDQENITAEAALDGIYVVRTSLPASVLDTDRTVCAYKGLAAAERAFRSLKTVDLKVRPIHHRLENRVRAHVLLCMLAYYVEWHMRKAWAPILFDDDDKPAGQARRASVVARAQRSERAEQKAATKQTADGRPVHSFQTLLADLATLTKNRVRFQRSDAATMTVYAKPTDGQQQALNLLQVSVEM